MKTDCLNCGHSYNGTTCPKCGTTLNASRSTSKSSDAWTYFERGDQKTAASSAAKSTAGTASKGSASSRKSAAAQKPASGKAARTNLQFGIGLFIVLLIFIAPNIFQNAGSLVVEEWEDESWFDDGYYLEDEFYEEESFFHNLAADYHFSDFIADYEPASALPADGHDYEMTLTPGLYVSGVHFPPGTYHLLARDGYGHVMNSFTSMVEILSVDDIIEDSFSALENIEFPCGAILEISHTLTLEISSENADESQTLNLTNPAAQTYTFSDGIWFTGEDFAAGIYDIELYETDLMAETSIQLSSGYAAYLYANDEPGDITTIRNIPFADGTTLEVYGDEIRLTPSSL